MVGISSFSGFRIKGNSLFALPKKPTKKIEFIGNSITCGYGNEGTKPTDKFRGSTENNYMAYGAITSRNLNAQYTAVCYSGIGVYRNYGGNRENTMPVIYDRIIPSIDNKKWNFKNYVPDVIVVDLGTNDFYVKPDSSLFVSAYENFIKLVRQKNPGTPIFCVLGPMMSGNGWKSIQQYISAMVIRFNKTDKNIHYFTLTPCQGSGSDFHPSVAQQITAATELTNHLKSKMGW